MAREGRRLFWATRHTYTCSNRYFSYSKKLRTSNQLKIFRKAGTAQIAGVGTRTVPNKRDGTMNIDAVEAAIRSDNVHFPVTELIAIENTHNYSGGRVLPAGYMEVRDSQLPILEHL